MHPTQYAQPSFCPFAADHATMLPRNEASDAQKEAAHAMLQLLFLVVHSQAQHYEAQQALAQKDSSAFPTSTMRHTTSCQPGVAPANAFQLGKEEIDMNLMDLTTCLSEFTHLCYRSALLHVAIVDLLQSRSLSAVAWLCLSNVCCNWL